MDQSLKNTIRTYEELICGLCNLRDEIDKFNTKINIANTVGTTSSTAGTVATCVGLFAAPFTGGASLLLTVGGIATTVAGAATNITTSLIDKSYTKDFVAEIEHYVVLRTESLKILTIHFEKITSMMDKNISSGLDDRVSLVSAIVSSCKKTEYQPTMRDIRKMKRILSIVMVGNAFSATKKLTNVLVSSGIIAASAASVAVTLALEKVFVELTSTSMRTMGKMAGIVEKGGATAGKISGKVLGAVAKPLAIVGVGIQVVEIVNLVKAWANDPPTIEAINELLDMLREHETTLREVSDEINEIMAAVDNEPKENPDSSVNPNETSTQNTTSSNTNTNSSNNQDSGNGNGSNGSQPPNDPDNLSNKNNYVESEMEKLIKLIKDLINKYATSSPGLRKALKRSLNTLCNNIRQWASDHSGIIDVIDLLQRAYNFALTNAGTNGFQFVDYFEIYVAIFTKKIESLNREYTNKLNQARQQGNCQVTALRDWQILNNVPEGLVSNDMKVALQNVVNSLLATYAMDIYNLTVSLCSNIQQVNVSFSNLLKLVYHFLKHGLSTETPSEYLNRANDLIRRVGPIIDNARSSGLSVVSINQNGIIGTYTTGNNNGRVEERINITYDGWWLSYVIINDKPELRTYFEI